MSLFNSVETLFIEVLLPFALPATFTYRVPAELNDEVVFGKRVSVPFGRKKIYAGIITAIHQNPPQNYQAKYIIDVLDNQPIIQSDHLELWKWISQYYMCTLGEVMNAALPSGLKLSGESKAVLTDNALEIVDLDDAEEKVVTFLSHQGEATLTQIAEVIGKTKIQKIVQSLYLKGGLVMKDDLHDSYKPKTVKHISLTETFRTDSALEVLMNALEKKGQKQLEVLMTFLGQAKRDAVIPVSPFLKNNNLSTSSLNTLVKHDVFEFVHIQEDRIAVVDADPADINLSEAQTKAYKDIQAEVDEHNTVLLHGVTSSGKTEIYFKLIDQCLEQDRQVLFLIPEIALTVQLIQRLYVQFGNEVVVSHSKFSKNERREIWQKVLNKEVRIIAGPRSSIFLPFQDLGLIIVDEEHESSYKQVDPAPRFNARDAAIALSKMKNCGCVLGSATPSIESYTNAKSNKYGFVSITERFQNAPLPEVEIVDFHQEKKRKQNKGLFSSRLISEMEKQLANDKQVILFQNRRGYVPITECHFCSWAPRCINCDISLTYYKFQNKLVCHYCGFKIDPISECGACGSSKIEMAGYGTERIEEELSVLFPDWKIDRMDHNTTRSKHGYKQIINRFQNKETQVLIGTQMVSKGLDFGGVGLVGILNADQLLHFPDFRSFERSYQTMVQVAGRAGRRSEQGHVIIQAGQPSHPVLSWVKNHDYAALFQHESNERQRFLYPPYARLIRILIKHKDYHHLDHCAEYIFGLLKPQLGDDLLGPINPHVGKIRTYYIKHFLVKIPLTKRNLKTVKDNILKVQKHLQSHPDFKNVRMYADVDPL